MLGWRGGGVGRGLSQSTVKHTTLCLLYKKFLYVFNCNICVVIFLMKIEKFNKKSFAYLNKFKASLLLQEKATEIEILILLDAKQLN